MGRVLVNESHGHFEHQLSFSTFNVLTKTDSNLLFSENFMKSLWAPASEKVHFWLRFHLLLKPDLLLLPSSWHLLNLLWRSFASHFHPPRRPSLFWQSCLDLLESLSNNELVFCVKKDIGILWQRKRGLSETWSLACTSFTTVVTSMFSSAAAARAATSKLFSSATLRSNVHNVQKKNICFQCKKVIFHLQQLWPPQQQPWLPRLLLFPPWSYLHNVTQSHPCTKRKVPKGILI